MGRTPSHADERIAQHKADRKRKKDREDGLLSQTLDAQYAGDTFGSCTNVGCVREHNEDSLLVRPPLYIVADGMGGHAAGEVASEIAVQTIAHQAPSRPNPEALGYAVESANTEIICAANSGRGRQGMGTTVTAAMIEGTRLVLAQVGDSRAYLLHQGVLQQLTRDHSLMADMIDAGEITPEEAKFHPQRSVITRALGASPYTRPDLYDMDVSSGDRLLLCSDGLSGMVEDSDIENTLRIIEDPQRCANRLVSQAIRNGGQDNVTAIVVDILGGPASSLRGLSKRTVIILLIVLLLLVVLAGTFIGIAALS